MCVICTIRIKYVRHLKDLNHTLNHDLVLQKIYLLVDSNYETWLKLYINMNTGLRTKSKNNSEKYLFDLISIFSKFDELVSELNYCTT